MDINIIQSMLDKTNYWDSEVNELTCSYFGDEVKLIFENKIQCDFTGCYRVYFDHEVKYKKFKAIKNYSEPQMPYFLHEISVKEKKIQNEIFYEVIIGMPPALNVKILCKDIIITEMDHS